MLKKTIDYTLCDMEALKILSDFLPDRIFDAHTHLFDSEFLPNACADTECTVADVDAYKSAVMPMLCSPKELRLNIIPYVADVSLADPVSNNLKKSDDFLLSQLKESDSNVGEIIVLPYESSESIQKRIIHPSIRGLKCYFLLSDEPNPSQLSPEKYLSEGAWEIAHKNKMCITLHLARDRSLSDPANLSYIKQMASRYPDAVLILAHAGRAFASWTGVEAVYELAKFENIWFDFSAICESPAIFQILRKIGTERCMWGSDFPVCTGHGKAISIAGGFYWIGENDLPLLSQKWVLGIENLMAVRQACIMADLSPDRIEDIFYNNASKLWSKKEILR